MGSSVGLGIDGTSGAGPSKDVKSLLLALDTPTEHREPAGFSSTTPPSRTRRRSVGDFSKFGSTPASMQEALVEDYRMQMSIPWRVSYRLGRCSFTWKTHNADSSGYCRPGSGPGSRQILSPQIPGVAPQSGLASRTGCTWGLLMGLNPACGLKIC
ncbi:uncharacterized protein BO66DRAFT_394797 [Aspergillus aculeatinus CBS 121060]|uniref:Uncharacterized protein n=1 Tax=Aspergillus aculeatinus CBS 121060 TaxID=1448322 RepID=A0ACD1GYA6_9EURO|nr:hypothetical protein BO66DRAFT_394797 [Aspergillus aculeatinus CBS 121060]RAH66274.1 hypothetical protein BO66DRAFT_394797 [Aspergillus aculeatinus CBS 121060]